MRIFKSKNIKAIGNVLPKDEFKFFSDMKDPAFNDRKMRLVVKEAEEMLQSEIPFLPASLYREFTLTGNRANFESKCFRRRRMALVLSLAEAYEKSGRFSEKLADVVWAIMEESTWIIPAHLYTSPLWGDATLGPVYEDSTMHGIDLFAAATGATLTTVYQYAKDALDKIEPIICKKMKHMLHQRITLPFLQSEFWWTGERGNRINNWCPWIISNILYTTAVTEDELYIRERVVSKALACIDNFIDGYAPDGGCDEGPSYWNAAGASLFDCLELLEDLSAGRINIYSEPLIKNIGEYICKMYISGNNFINFADCNPKLIFDCSMLVRYGKKLGSEILESLGKKMATIRDFTLDQNLGYRTAKGIFYPDIPKDDCVAATRVWFPDLKVMVAREISDPNTGLLLGAKGGHNDEMHNHNDVGNFVVYYDGKPVLIDTGVGTYTKQTFSPQRYELWFMQSGYHNLPSFGGVDQKNGRRFASKNEVYDEDKRSLTLEISEAYPEAAGLIAYTRQMSLGGGEVAVTDSFELNEKKEVVFHYMCPALPTLEETGVIALAEGRKMYYDKALSAEIEEFDPVGMNTKASWGTDKLWRIKLSANVKSGSFTVKVK